MFTGEQARFFFGRELDVESMWRKINRLSLAALIGPSGVGKSSLLNRLLGHERSIVSPIPGTTRDSLDDVFQYQGKTIRLVDTAGLRKKSKVEEDIEYYSNVRTIQAIEHADVVIQLLDASEPMMDQDKKIVETVMDKGRGLVLAYNKWDLKFQSNDENYRVMEDCRDAVYKEIPAYPFVPLEFISAKTGYKIPRLLDMALKVYQDFHYRVPTAILNEWLEKEVRESDTRLPVADLKVYYASQVHSAPPRFVFFVNKKDFVRKDYGRHLENKLRVAFEFTGVPMKVTFREKSERKK